MEIALGEGRDVGAEGVRLQREETRGQRLKQEIIEQVIRDANLKNSASIDDLRISQIQMRVNGQNSLAEKILLSIKFARLVSAALGHAAKKGNNPRPRGFKVAANSKLVNLPCKQLPFLVRLAKLANATPSFLNELIKGKRCRELTIENLLSRYACDPDENFGFNLEALSFGPAKTRKSLQRFMRQKTASMFKSLSSLYDAFGMLFCWASLTPVKSAA